MIAKFLCLIFGHKFNIQWVNITAHKTTIEGIGKCMRCGQKDKK